MIKIIPKTPEEAWESAAEIIEEYFKKENPKGFEVLMKIHNEKKEDMLKFPAAIKQHHCQAGGYIIHVNEVMMIVKDMLENGFGMGMVDESKAILAAYVHDLDKLERYEPAPHEDPSDKQLDLANRIGIDIPKGISKKNIGVLISNKLDEKDNPLEFFRFKRKDGHNFDETAKVQQMLVPYKLPLPDEVLHAVTMHHGGYAVHAKEFHMKMSPMATLLNAADMISSKIMANVE